MELRRITGQSKSLRDFYDLSSGWAGHWIKPITAMLELITYLEEDVDAEPQWVFTSHENLVFVGQDEYRHSLLSVHPLGEIHEGPARARYEIRRPAKTPWSHTIGYAESVEQAWQMIGIVLSEAPAHAGSSRV